nr:hypothetical protein CFP56_74666 [Quercus suber]
MWYIKAGDEPGRLRDGLRTFFPVANAIRIGGCKFKIGAPRRSQRGLAEGSGDTDALLVLLLLPTCHVDWPPRTNTDPSGEYEHWSVGFSFAVETLLQQARATGASNDRAFLLLHTREFDAILWSRARGAVYGVSSHPPHVTMSPCVV